MNNTILDITQEIGFLNEQLAYIETLIQNATAENDTKEYARLMRLYLPMQKSLLKLYAERSRLEAADNAEVDPLLSFADSTGLSA